MYGYTEYLWNEAEKSGEKKGMNKALLKTYATMKDANCSDSFIRSMLAFPCGSCRKSNSCSMNPSPEREDIWYGNNKDRSTEVVRILEISLGESFQ
jgi:hypothetical protein